MDSLAAGPSVGFARAAAITDYGAVFTGDTDENLVACADVDVVVS